METLFYFTSVNTNNFVWIRSKQLSFVNHWITLMHFDMIGWFEMRLLASLFPLLIRRSPLQNFAISHSAVFQLLVLTAQIYDCPKVFEQQPQDFLAVVMFVHVLYQCEDYAPPADRVVWFILHLAKSQLTPHYHFPHLLPCIGEKAVIEGFGLCFRKKLSLSLWLWKPSLVRTCFSSFSEMSRFFTSFFSEYNCEVKCLFWGIFWLNVQTFQHHPNVCVFKTQDFSTRL